MASVGEHAKRHGTWVGILTALVIGVTNHFVSVTPEGVTEKVDSALEDKVRSAETRMEKATEQAERARDKLETHIDERLRAMAEIRDLKLANLTHLLESLKPMVASALLECKGRAATVEEKLAQARLEERWRQIDDAIARLQRLETDFRAFAADVDGLFGDPAPGDPESP